MRLFDPALHEPLTSATWSEAVARAGAAEIFEEAIAELSESASGLWPVHPDDADLADDPATLHATGVYFGAAGVAIALHWLAQRGGVEPPAGLARVCERLRGLPAEPAFDYGPRSWMFGTTGVEAAAVVVAGAPLDETLAQAALALERATHDPLTGVGNVLSGLVAMHRLHPDDGRIAELVRSGSARELAALAAGPDECDAWLVDLYGTPRWMLGAGHGAAGTLQGMLAGGDLLPEVDRARALRVARELVAAAAIRDGDLVNWPAVTGADEPWFDVQWCHDAPGILIALGRAGDGHRETRELLIGGGELIWQAGPLAKGASICHGTAGSALALLELFHLTQDELWLERARALSVHALGQVRARRAQVGRGRFSLMTGDLGVATTLVQCADVMPGIVGLDLL